MTPNVIGTNLAGEPALCAWLKRASRKVSNPLSAIEIPPPMLNPKLLVEPPPPLAPALYQPAPPIAYGEKLAPGILYTRLPVTLV